jgi:hypothetical protein
MASLYDASILVKLYGDMSNAISKSVLVVRSMNHSSRLMNVETIVSGCVKEATTQTYHRKLSHRHGRGRPE